MIVSEIFLAVLEMDKIVVESVIEKMDIHLKVNVITIPDDKDRSNTTYYITLLENLSSITSSGLIVAELHAGLKFAKYNFNNLNKNK